MWKVFWFSGRCFLVFWLPANASNTGIVLHQTWKAREKSNVLNLETSKNHLILNSYNQSAVGIGKETAETVGNYHQLPQQPLNKVLQYSCAMSALGLISSGGICHLNSTWEIHYYPISEQIYSSVQDWKSSSSTARLNWQAVL